MEIAHTYTLLPSPPVLLPPPSLHPNFFSRSMAALTAVRTKGKSTKNFNFTKSMREGKGNGESKKTNFEKGST